MTGFICPVCRQKLNDKGSLYRCEGGHCFDKSRFGYVNLLMSNQSSDKRHGDDRLMIRARRDFLSKGYYSFLLHELKNICRQYLPSDAVILDAGCGECYYSMGIKADNPAYSFMGIDISKDALEFAGKRGADFPLCVASLYDMPVADESANCVINCFSPKADAEFERVLKKGGILIRVVPLEKHLFSLKASIYETPYENEKPLKDIDNLTFSDYREVKKTLEIDNNEDIQNLFRMTPYYYKTGREDQEKLNSLTAFTTEAEFGIFVYTKEND